MEAAAQEAAEADVAKLGNLKSEIGASLMDSYGDHRKRKASDAEQSSPSPPTNRCPSTSSSSMCLACVAYLACVWHIFVRSKML